MTSKERKEEVKKYMGYLRKATENYEYAKERYRDKLMEMSLHRMWHGKDKEYFECTQAARHYRTAALMWLEDIHVYEREILNYI